MLRKATDRVLYRFVLLGCIECMRCRLLLPMFAVSVCLSVTRRVQCVWGSFGAAFAKLLWPLIKWVFVACYLCCVFWVFSVLYVLFYYSFLVVSTCAPSEMTYYESCNDFEPFVPSTNLICRLLDYLRAMNIQRLGKYYQIFDAAR